MARVAVPIIHLVYPADAAYDHRIVDVFERAGTWQPQETYTFTGRVSVADPHSPRGHGTPARDRGGPAHVAAAC